MNELCDLINHPLQVLSIPFGSSDLYGEFLNSSFSIIILFYFFHLFVVDRLFNE